MNLREARFSRRISQWDIARKAGISQGRISLIENGYVTPRLEEKTAIASALGCDVEELWQEFQVEERWFAGPECWIVETWRIYPDGTKALYSSVSDVFGISIS